MPNSKYWVKKLRFVSRIILIVFLLCIIIFSIYKNIEKDDLYYYQWAYHNDGNFYVDRGIIADNYAMLYYDKKYISSLYVKNNDALNFLRYDINDPGIAYAKYENDIRWEKAYDIFSKIKNKRDVTVAIIDSGIDINHYEICDNIWVNEKEIAGNGIDDDGNGYIDDVNGYNFYNNNSEVFTDSNIDIHGTHAAGTIVGKHDNGGIKGMAYDTHIKVMPLKILGQDGFGSVRALVEAIKYAKNNGAKICNISLGLYEYDEMLDEVIRENQDMIFVVAAGNGKDFIGYSLDERDVYPAKFEYPNVITVSNIGFDGERYLSSNYGSFVDVFAPGTFILSIAPDNKFGYLTGTSTAAPFVSAACAMIYSAYERVPLYLYKEIIIKTATKVSEIDTFSKSGILNIEKVILNASTF